MLFYKRKGSRDDYNNSRGISLPTVPGKVCGSVLNVRVMKIIVIHISVGNEQWVFSKGRGCVDEIFVLKMIVGKHI